MAFAGEELLVALLVGIVCFLLGVLVVLLCDDVAIITGTRGPVQIVSWRGVAYYIGRVVDSSNLK